MRGWREESRRLSEEALRDLTDELLVEPDLVFAKKWLGREGDLYSKVMK